MAQRIDSGMTEIAAGPRIAREKRTVEKMIRFHCERKHKTKRGFLCEDCSELSDYSMHRLDHCQFGEEKPTCRKCTVHCYRPTMREKIREVMGVFGC